MVLFFIIFAALFGIVYWSESAARRTQAKQDDHDLRLEQIEKTALNDAQEVDIMSIKLVDLASRIQLILKGLGAPKDYVENGSHFFMAAHGSFEEFQVNFQF